MKRRALAMLLGAIAIAPLAVAQTQGRDDGAEEGESASASASVAPIVPRLVPIVEKDGMVFVSGGRFTMGSNDAKAEPNEKPSRDATSLGFWIDRTEVTVGAYRDCVADHKCSRPQTASTLCTFDTDDDALPVNCVAWQQADSFCRAFKKRLPTETEWELAARGGGAYKYPWGNASSSCSSAATLLHDATGRSCTGRKPAHVGSYPSNVSPFGAVDMAGNVEEWTSDWYVEHPASGVRPTSGASHVLRGGGWLSRPIDSRTTSRNWGSSMEAGPNVGFRCVRDG